MPEFNNDNNKNMPPNQKWGSRSRAMEDKDMDNGKKSSLLKAEESRFTELESIELGAPVGDSKELSVTGPQEGPGGKVPTKKALSEKPERKIDNLEQLIAYAYSRKGKRISLQPAEEKRICSQPQLSIDARNRLFALAQADYLLAVPRQLLLIMRDIVGYTSLRNELKDFVGVVLKRHPIFSLEELQAVICGREDAIGTRHALEMVATQDLLNLSLDTEMAPSKFKTLGNNAVYCLALWLAEARDLSPWELSRTLFDAFWYAEGKKVTDSTKQLRLITEIKDLTGVGLVCRAFIERVDKETRLAVIAQQSEAKAQDKVQSLSAKIEHLEKNLKEREGKVKNLEVELQNQMRQHENAVSHMQDDYELMRSQVLRRLKSDANLLADGLHALRREPPKVRVMDDHAERVLEGLRREINQFESGG